MKKSKKVLLIITAFIIVTGVASCPIYRYYYENYVRVRNVFDQIFYTGLSIPMSTSSSRWFVEDDGSRRRGTEYRSSYLGENRVIDMSFTDRGENGRGTVRFTLSWTFPDSDESMLFTYRYYVHYGELLKRLPAISIPRPGCHIGMRDWHNEPEIIDEFLSRHGLTREEIEELHDWFLFEHLLPRWYEAPPTRTRFSPENWGEFILVNEEYTQYIDGLNLGSDF